jgi:hypothetical protein
MRMNIEKLKESLQIDIIDTEFLMKSRKEKFIEGNLSASDYAMNNSYSSGYLIAMKMILNRINEGLE